MSIQALLGDAYQVLSDCPHCRTEAAVVHLMDPLHPACHLGVAVTTRCRLCGWTTAAEQEPFAPRHPLASGRCPACNRRLSEAARAGEAPCPHCDYLPTVRAAHPPRDLSDETEARAALRRWAEEEQEADVETFCGSNMGLSCDEVVRRLREREPVPTTFDVIAYLFPGTGSLGTGAKDPKLPELVDREPEAPPEPEAPRERGTMDPRTPARLLISVMLADGELRRGERQFIRRFLEREGLEPLRQSDLRVWRPAELGTPPDPELAERLLEAAVHLAHLDREREGSEWKVIHAFATAWGVPRERIEKWDARYDQRYATAMTRLWRNLSRLVRVH